MHNQQLTVVLAHGAWSDGSSWSKVIAALAAQGIRSVTAALPLTGLNEDVAALDRTLEHVCGPVVLAGHAYAGAVIGATRHPAVKALVYVAALAPAEGETVADVFYRNEPHPLAPKLAPDAQGLIWFPEEAFPVAFAPNATAQENTVLAAAQRPPSLPCLTTPAPRPRWLDVPAWYLLAKQDRMILERTQRFMAERMKAHIAEHDVDHTPSVTAPQTVVELILRAARASA